MEIAPWPAPPIRRPLQLLDRRTPPQAHDQTELLRRPMPRRRPPRQSPTISAGAVSDHAENRVFADCYRIRSGRMRRAGGSGELPPRKACAGPAMPTAAAPPLPAPAAKAAPAPRFVERLVQSEAVKAVSVETEGS